MAKHGSEVLIHLTICEREGLAPPFFLYKFPTYLHCCASNKIIGAVNDNISPDLQIYPLWPDIVIQLGNSFAAVVLLRLKNHPSSKSLKNQYQYLPANRGHKII